MVKRFPFGHGGHGGGLPTRRSRGGQDLEDLWQKAELVPFDMDGFSPAQFWGEPVMEPTPPSWWPHILLSRIRPGLSLGLPVSRGGDGACLREGRWAMRSVVCTDRPDHGGHFQHLRYGGGRRTGRGGRVRSAAGVPRGGQPGRGPRRRLVEAAGQPAVSRRSGWTRACTASSPSRPSTA
ncbi:MAG: hypothetical protein ACLRWQ_05670 [Flavonifractor plautii]